MLIVFSGLPGTGKTTISRLVSSRLAAVYLRIDAIEHAICEAGIASDAVGASGYAVAQTIAEANLTAGLAVVADCVNPVAESRLAWSGVASRSASPMLDVEVICSDPAEHRRRVVSRTADIPGHSPPSWEMIANLPYEPWDRPRLIIDTASLSPPEGADAVLGASRRIREDR